MPINDPEDAISSTNRLLEMLKYEDSTEVLKKLVQILSQLALHPFIESRPIVDTFVSLFNKNSLLSSDILRSIALICTCKQQNLNDILDKIVDKVHHGSSTRTRMAYLRIIVSLTHHSDGMMGKTHEMLIHYLKDSDSRVRKSAFSLLGLLNSKNIHYSFENHLYPQIYKASVEALDDDYEDVRIEAMKIIWLISNLYPQFVDDGFRKICTMVSDTSTSVRALACSLLGTISHVSGHLLHQSLNKNVIKVEEDTTDQSYQSQDIDIMEVTSRLIENCANGAFIHGLEDEYLEVRSAAIHSISELSQGSLDFGVKAVEFIVDMFNDEIEIIRSNSLYSLAKMGESIQLTESQLQVVLAIFNDVSPKVRLAAHSLLRTTLLQNVKCLKLCIQNLLTDAIRHPHEKNIILNTLREIGANHPYFVEMDIEDLLGIDPRFLSRENRLDDFNYIGILTIVLNAAHKNSNMISLMPSHISKHYLYMRSRYNDLVPYIPNLGSIHVDTFTYAKQRNMDDVFRKLVTKVTTIPSFIKRRRLKDVLSLVNHCKIEFQRIGGLDDKLFGSSELYMYYLDIIAIVAKIQCSSIDSEKYRNLPFSRAIKLSYDLQQLFIGLSQSQLIHIRTLRIFAFLSMQVRIDQIEREKDGNKKSFDHVYYDIDMRVTNIIENCHSDLQKHQLGNLPDLDYLRGSLFNQTRFTLNQYDSLIGNMPFVPFDLNNFVLMKRAIITEPSNNYDTPFEFHNFLPFKFTISATIENIENPSTLVIHIQYPDLSTESFPIRHTDLTLISPYNYRYHGKLSLVPTDWPTRSNISISIAVAGSPDIVCNNSSTVNELSLSKHHITGEPMVITNISSQTLIYCLQAKINWK